MLRALRIPSWTDDRSSQLFTVGAIVRLGHERVLLRHNELSQVFSSVIADMRLNVAAPPWSDPRLVWKLAETGRPHNRWIACRTMFGDLRGHHRVVIIQP
ncbi:hypothetical protein TM239_07160 [Bradyrhizobium sp. TM239]|nr:hypothetical protein TM239_07160 [Bradyrhizobium sp. TM239]